MVEGREALDLFEMRMVETQLKMGTMLYITVGFILNEGFLDSNGMPL
jgi:hypothetical protein